LVPDDDPFRKTFHMRREIHPNGVSCFFKDCGDVLTNRSLPIGPCHMDYLKLLVWVT
jgi:hypothetical protein